MTAPVRIQRRRVKGWTMPEGAIYVGRPGRFGNPYAVRRQRGRGWCVFAEYGGRPIMINETEQRAREYAVHLYEGWTRARINRDLYFRDEVAALAGHDLACWCRLDVACHADVLLKLANEGHPDPTAPRRLVAPVPPAPTKGPAMPVTDWTPQVGEIVAVITTTYGEPSRKLITITGETKTRWKTDDGHAWRKTDLERVGESGSMWRPMPRLFQVGSPEEATVAQAMNLRHAQREARLLTEKATDLESRDPLLVRLGAIDMAIAALRNLADLVRQENEATP